MFTAAGPLARKWAFFPLGQRWRTGRSSLRQDGFTALIGKCVSHEVDLTPLRATVPFSAGGVSERHSGLAGIERRALRFDGDRAKLLARSSTSNRRAEVRGFS